VTEVGDHLLGRAVRIGTVMAKYGFRERVGGEEPLQARAANLRAALEELGPTFAKLGQILSTRPDLMPPEFVAELAKLQDDVPPLSEAEVVSMMEEELGVPWEDVFESIDPEPLAAGTIGQVHRSTLENGDRVVVKVQRPTAQGEILRDLGLLELFAEKTENRAAFRQIVDLPAVIEHLSNSLRRELDFRQEAQNIDRMREVLAPFPRLGVARVYHELSTSRLLVQEEIQGVPVRQAPAGAARKEAARQLLESYYRQILTDGFFHADPHPGNLMWWNERIYLLDLGMVGELGPEMRELTLLLLMAFWQEDTAFLGEVVLLLGGEQPPDLDLQAFQDELGGLMESVSGKSLNEIQLGPIMQGITEVATRHDVRLPASLALTGKALAQMQLAAGELDPELDPFSIVGPFLLKGLLEKIRGGADPKKLFYEAQKLKVRGERLIESFERITGARPGSRLQVEFRGTAPLESTIREAVRRLSLAALAGSAIVSSAITAAASRVETWVPVTLGSVGAALSAVLLAELLRRR
jgi:ubiquinone biosynthesis protein